MDGGRERETQRREREREINTTESYDVTRRPPPTVLATLLHRETDRKIFQARNRQDNTRDEM